jgi:fumarate hydratase class II
MRGVEYRVERDTLGEVRVPSGAYFGAQTQRALENFQISGLRFPRRFIRALGLVKLAAARANVALGVIDEERGRAIEQAAREVVEGKLDDQFVLDIFQTGSGTSTNMNANEVIANRAIEILGGRRGDKSLVHPNDHVNRGQSTNDVFPTAMHIAAYEAIVQHLIPSLRILHEALVLKSQEFSRVVKAGRTHLQDALPITLGQEFGAYARMVEQGMEELQRALVPLRELAIGGTAVGTGFNAPKGFAELVIREINRETGYDFVKARDSFEALQGRHAMVAASSAVKAVAVSLMKIANDLRLLNSGPNTGLGEIELPALQPGSSAMPGKVNPVLPEAVNMVCAMVMGNDLTVTICAQAGQLELNTMMPVMIYCLLQSIEILGNASRALAEKCILGIRADVERCRAYAENSLMVVTALAPKLGYDRAAQYARKAREEGKPLRMVLIEEGMDSKEVDELLDVYRMAMGG